MSVEFQQAITHAPRHAAQPSGSTTHITFRVATPADATAIAHIYNESVPAPSALTEAAGQPAPSEGATRPLWRSRMATLSDAHILPWLSLHEQSHRPLWLAEEDGNVIAWLSLLGFSDRPGCACAAEVALYVARARQGTGVGTRLLHKAVQEARALDIDRLMAFIWQDNTASLGLFRKQGYTAWGALPGAVWADGRSLDMVILGRELGPASSSPAHD